MGVYAHVYDVTDYNSVSGKAVVYKISNDVRGIGIKTVEIDVAGATSNTLRYLVGV